VWERGVGFTEACGTGACACAVAAVETGRVTREQPVIVKLPGGPLEIRVGARGDRISMKGPARHVFDGTFVLR
jgi:diaminopimelate epimerase